MIAAPTQHSSLISFLNGEKPPDELWQEIGAEVTECVAATPGGVGHVIITTEQGNPHLS
jgi:hypothetical protein